MRSGNNRSSPNFSPFAKDWRNPRRPYEKDMIRKKAVLRQEFSIDKVRHVM